MADDETKRKFRELLEKKQQASTAGNNGPVTESQQGKTGGAKNHQKQIRRKSG